MKGLMKTTKNHYHCNWF